jgi:hypothetical protein
MILKFLFTIKEYEDNLIFKILNTKKEITIDKIVSNNFFLFWTNQFLIIELEKEYILKSLKTNNKYRFEKGSTVYTAYEYFKINKGEENENANNI